MSGTITEPSVMSLFIQMRFDGQPLATGTGFAVMGNRGPILITNRHNVTGRNQESGELLSKTGGVPNELAIVHNKLDQLGQWVERIEPLYQDERPCWVEHPGLGEKADFVALPLTQLDDVHIYPYNPVNPGPNILVGPSDVVSVVGFPFGMAAGGAFAVWATGFMASEPEVLFRGFPQFLIDCRSRQGQSGSAVIAYRSGGTVATKTGATVYGGPVFRFLGIYSGRINTESDLGIVWRADSLVELINSIR